MESKVYFTDFRTSYSKNTFKKLAQLLKKSDAAHIIADGDLTALKLHFGEYGNTAFIRPIYIRKIVELVKENKGIPFLTDCNTVYAGSRSDAIHHIPTAIQNGFAYSTVDAPIVIGDGLRGRSESVVEINKKNFTEAFIGKEIVEADSLISIAHFKGHELAGFGGALKNLGMGCASRRGKLAQHSTVSPKVVKKKCIGCNQCGEYCSQQAIAIIEKKAQINDDKCIGCGECILICPNRAIEIKWNQTVPIFLERMMEYTFAVLKNKRQKSFFINFLMDITPACDCLPNSDAAIVGNIGILASNDPVAIDQASVNLVNQAPGLANSCLTKNTQPGADKFKGIYPNVDWQIQLDYAQNLGIGSRSYQLIEI